jgi:hypothetical protein
MLVGGLEVHRGHDIRDPGDGSGDILRKPDERGENPAGPAILCGCHDGAQTITRRTLNAVEEERMRRSGHWQPPGHMGRILAGNLVEERRRRNPMPARAQ